MKTLIKLIKNLLCPSHKGISKSLQKTKNKVNRRLDVMTQNIEAEEIQYEKLKEKLGDSRIDARRCELRMDELNELDYQ